MNTSLTTYRRYLTRKDECIKAYKFINAASKLVDNPEVKADAELAYMQVAHIYDSAIYKKFYGENLDEIPMPEGDVFDDRVYADRLRWVKPLLIKQKAKTVLDLGCSEGSYSLNIARAGFNVTGVNLFKSSIEIAKERAKKFGLEKQTNFVNADIYDFKGKFDAVLLFEVIEHVRDDKEMIKHLMSLTNENGICYISTPDGVADERASGSTMMSRALRGHVRAYTEKTLRELLKDYEIVDFYKSTTDSIKLLQIAFKRK